MMNINNKRPLLYAVFLSLNKKYRNMKKTTICAIADSNVVVEAEQLKSLNIVKELEKQGFTVLLQIDSINNVVIYGIKKGDIHSSINEYHIFLNDTSLIERGLLRQKQAIKNFLKSYTK